MKIKCKNKKCNHIWDYKGKADFYATCPNCMRKNKLPEKKTIKKIKEKNE